MTYFEIKKKLIDLIQDVLETDVYYSESKRIEDIGFDSLSFMNLVIKIEVEFDIDFDDDYLNIDRFYTIKDIINYILSKKKS